MRNMEMDCPRTGFKIVFPEENGDGFWLAGFQNVVGCRGDQSRAEYGASAFRDGVDLQLRDFLSSSIRTPSSAINFFFSLENSLLIVDWETPCTARRRSHEAFALRYQSRSI
jgi:hypothetical protein